MKFAAIAALLLLASSSCVGGQNPAEDFLDGLGLARVKTYSSHRVSSGNANAASNDDSKRILPGETLVMADLSGAGMITHIWVTVANNEFGWPRLLRLRVYYDGHKTPSVDAPLGDFFGVSHGSERDLNSIMIHDSSLGRARNSYWPMPYRKSCRITVTNEGERIVPMFYYHVDYRKYPTLPPNLGYFHAYYRQERPARAGHNYEFLNVRGTGHYVGTVMGVIQTQLSWFGEGDDLFYIDGAKQPQIYGTGSEDYFNDAWGLRDSDGPWTGTPMAEGERLGSRLSAYRWHIPDPIAFRTSLWAGIEHAGWTANEDGSVRSAFEERPDYFYSVAFWYQRGVQEDLPEVPYGSERLPFGNATQIAIEDSLADVTAEGGTASVQREVDWSKDLLFPEAKSAGAKINIPIDIPETGQYEMIAMIAQAPDYGDYLALLDGQPTNLDTRQAATSEIPFPGPEIFHNYLSEVYVARDRALGMFQLAKGRHVLTFVCTGKDPRSAGYNFGIQEVVLERVLQTLEAPIEAQPTAPALPTTTVAIYRGKPLSFYMAKLNSGAESEQASLLRAIGSFGTDATPAAAKLTKLLASSSTEVRGAAANALAQIGPSATQSVPVLAKLLPDSAPRLRCQAALALKLMGARSSGAISELTRALGDPVPFVRAGAADALGAIGPGSRAAVPALIERLKIDPGPNYVLDSAIYALRDIGPDAREAIPALEEISHRVRLTAPAQEAILQIQGKPVPVYH
jgi:D-arabinan exo alpha-(1,3)/(1,5)-arabinofuranosidase (non-reducing end)